ncbi:MAG: matrixin family metalloprotease [Bryobacteraceae bacterium]
MKTRMGAEALPHKGVRSTLSKRLPHSRLHYLVQFREAPQPEALQELARQGVKLLEYVPNYGFMISAEESTTIEGMDLTLVERLRPEDKLSPLLLETEQAPEAAGPQVFVVEFHRDVEQQDARQVVRQNGLPTREHPDLLPNQLLVDGTVEDAARLADWDEVEYVFPASRELKEGERVHACAGALTVYGQAGQITALYGSGWDGPGLGSAQLGYFFGVLASALPRAAVQTEILRAWAEWSKYVQVTFSPVSTANQARTIALLFALGEHGDGNPFDGPGGVLAHTFYPAPPNPESIAGDMHFDASENWGIGKGVDVFSVVLHETGHALGLGHSDHPGDVMYPYYSVWTGLTPDDIASIQMLYASAGTTPGAPAPTVTITSPTSGGTYTTTAATVKLAGTAQHPDGIAQVFWANSLGGTGVASGTQTWTAGPVALQPGQNQISVMARATSGSTAVKSLTVTYSSTTDTVPPRLTILSPLSLSVTTTASSVFLMGTAGDNVGVKQVTWSRSISNADSAGNAGVAQGTSVWNTGPIALAVGTQTITITAFDAAGNTASRSVVFTRK